MSRQPTQILNKVSNQLPRFSIRAYLFTALVGIILLGWFVMAMANYYAAKEQIEELFDAELAQQTRLLESMIYSRYQEEGKSLSQLLYFESPEVLAATTPNESTENEHEILPNGHRYERKIAFRVWNSNGKVIVGTGDMPEQDFDTLRPGFHTTSYNHTTWRSFALKNDTFDFWIQAAQSDDVRTELTEEIAIFSVIPGLFIAPVLLIICLLALNGGIRHLTDLTNQLARRDYDNLKPIPLHPAPKEIHVLTTGINQLLARLSEAQKRERRFTADAAHELRTPLSVMQVHLQNAQQQLENTENPASTIPISRSLSSALEGARRMTHLVTQLLTLSRIDAREALPSTENQVDLVSALRQNLQNHEQTSGKTLQLEECDPPVFSLPLPQSLAEILVNNLIENALKYRKGDSPIHVRINQNSVTIENRCFPLAEDVLSRLTERFFRGNTEAPGSGLGLAICHGICQRHDVPFTVRQDILDEDEASFTVIIGQFENTVYTQSQSVTNSTKSCLDAH